MTYLEKIKELNRETRSRLIEYKSLAVKTKEQLDTGTSITLEEAVERDKKFTQFQMALAEYHQLIQTIASEKIRFDSEYEQQRSVVNSA